MTKLFSPSSARLFGAALLAVSLSSFPENVEAFSAAATTTSTSSSTTAADVAVPPVQVADPNNPLIQLANEFTYTKSGFYSPYDEDAFSDDFVFRGPYIGKSSSNPPLLYYVVRVSLGRYIYIQSYRLTYYIFFAAIPSLQPFRPAE